jgi:hypothetical protein
LLKFGFKDGGTWVIKNATMFIFKEFIFKSTHFDFTINIAFEENIKNWNDYDNVLILDEDFGQPYFPFYHHFNDNAIYNFPTLEFCVEKYNEYMSSLPFLIEVQANG